MSTEPKTPVRTRSPTTERVSGLLVWIAAFALFAISLALPATDFTAAKSVTDMTASCVVPAVGRTVPTLSCSVGASLKPFRSACPPHPNAESAVRHRSPGDELPA